MSSPLGLSSISSSWLDLHVGRSCCMLKSNLLFVVTSLSSNQLGLHSYLFKFYHQFFFLLWSWSCPGLFPALPPDGLLSWSMYYVSSFSFFRFASKPWTPQGHSLIPSCLEYYNSFRTFCHAYSLFLFRFMLYVSCKLIFIKHCPDYCHSRL